MQRDELTFFTVCVPSKHAKYLVRTYSQAPADLHLYSLRLQ